MFLLSYAALSRGWMVEMWSWGGHCPVYDRFKTTHPQYFVVRSLNQHRQSLTYRITAANGNNSYGSNPSYGQGQNGGVLPHNSSSNYNGSSNVSNGSSFYNTHNTGPHDVSGRSSNGNYHGNYRQLPPSASDHHPPPPSQQQQPAVATHEEVAIKLHKYICFQSFDRCISAYDLNQFYTKHPECRYPLIELGASVFCNQDGVRHLLRWEHGSNFAGGGRVHALSERDSERQTSIFATPSPGLGLMYPPPQQVQPQQQQQQQSHMSLTSGPPPLPTFDFAMNQNNSNNGNNNMLFDASTGLSGGGGPLMSSTSTRRRGPADAVIPLSNPFPNGSTAMGIGSISGGYEDHNGSHMQQIHTSTHSDSDNHNHNNFPHHHAGTDGHSNGLSHIQIHSNGYLSSQMSSHTVPTETSSSLLSSSSSMNNQSQSAQLKVPEFECPISMDVMRDPVVTKYGESLIISLVRS